jgi:plasmid stabilization system protein ParE
LTPPRFIVRPAAEAEIAEAALWYDTRAAGLGAEFLRAVDACFAEIQRAPARFPIIHGETRKAFVRRFPYVVYFVSTRRRIRVVACMHSKRDPLRWQQRL